MCLDNNSTCDLHYSSFAPCAHCCMQGRGKGTAWLNQSLTHTQTHVMCAVCECVFAGRSVSSDIPLFAFSPTNPLLFSPTRRRESSKNINFLLLLFRCCISRRRRTEGEKKKENERKKILHPGGTHFCSFPPIFSSSSSSSCRKSGQGGGDWNLGGGRLRRRLRSNLPSLTSLWLFWRQRKLLISMT